MQATKGVRLGGRKKGTPNAKTQDVIDKLKRLGHDPITGMAKIAMGKVPCGKCNKTGRIEQMGKKGIEKTVCPTCHGTKLEPISPELRGRMNAELAEYMYPKRKAIEVTGAGGEPIQHAHTIKFVD